MELDSDDSGKVFTISNNGSPFRNWLLKSINNGEFVIMDIEIGLVLDSNYAMSVFTYFPDGSDYQKWTFNRRKNGFIIRNMET